MPLAKEAIILLLASWRGQREFNVNHQEKTHQRELHPLEIIKPCDNTGIEATGAPPTLKQRGDSGITHPFLGIECNCHQEQHPHAGNNSANVGHHHLLMKSNAQTEAGVSRHVSLHLRILVNHGGLQKSWTSIVICFSGHTEALPGTKEYISYLQRHDHDK